MSFAELLVLGATLFGPAWPGRPGWGANPRLRPKGRGGGLSAAEPTRCRRSQRVAARRREPGASTVVAAVGSSVVLSLVLFGLGLGLNDGAPKNPKSRRSFPAARLARAPGRGNRQAPPEMEAEQRLRAGAVRGRALGRASRTRNDNPQVPWTHPSRDSPARQAPRKPPKAKERDFSLARPTSGAPKRSVSAVQRTSHGLPSLSQSVGAVETRPR